MRTTFRTTLCTAVLLLALLAPAALANDQGTVQTQQPPLVPAQPETSDTSTAAVVGTLAGLLVLAGALIAIKQRRRPGQAEAD